MSLLLFTFPFQHFGLGSKRLGQGGHLLGDQGISRPLGNQQGLCRLLFQSLGGLAHLHLTSGRLGCSTGTTPRLRQSPPPSDRRAELEASLLREGSPPVATRVATPIARPVTDSSGTVTPTRPDTDTNQEKKS